MYIVYVVHARHTDFYASVCECENNDEVKIRSRTLFKNNNDPIEVNARIYGRERLSVATTDDH